MTLQRTCGGCGGSGSVYVWEGWSDACPVCNGTGKVDAKASRQDALADAESLLRWAESQPSTIDDFDWRLKDESTAAVTAILRVPERHVSWPDDIWRGTNSAEILGETYELAARAAFRAVPGLRGE